MTERPSIHCVEDRADRVAYIATTVGFGEIVRQITVVDTTGRECLKCITDTGVIIVKNPIKQTVVTMYICTLSQAKSMFDGAPLPTWLYNRVVKNKKHLDKQDKMKYNKVSKKERKW